MRHSEILAVAVSGPAPGRVAAATAPPPSGARTVALDDNSRLRFSSSCPVSVCRNQFGAKRPGGGAAPAAGEVPPRPPPRPPPQRPPPPALDAPHVNRAPSGDGREPRPHDALGR